jgi:hypothetical protein
MLKTPASTQAEEIVLVRKGGSQTEARPQRNFFECRANVICYRGFWSSEGQRFFAYAQENERTDVQSVAVLVFVDVDGITRVDATRLPPREAVLQEVSW